MITIYCTTGKYTSPSKITDVRNMSEQELASLFNSDPTALILVAPHGDSVFRRLFIEPHLEDGYVHEGVFQASLCGKVIDYRIVEDINSKNARRNYKSKISKL